jgi:hypothetical protein
LFLIFIALLPFLSQSVPRRLPRVSHTQQCFHLL